MHDGGVRRYVSDLAATWPTDDRRWSRRNATVVVADVSGFTRLSARLGSLGAEGTEAVKDIINGIFEPCLEHALSAGGDVIKFAGDGFLTIFEGDDHPARAAEAAAAMQRTVRALDAFRTPAGRVRPRMTIGAETGDVVALVIGREGQDRCDLVVTGPVVDGAFALDSSATPGQIRIGEALTSTLPRTWTRRLAGREGRRLHIPAVPARVGSSTRRSEADDRASEFLDPEVVKITERGLSPAEHRTIAVAFVVIDGMTKLGRDAGPEALTGRLNDIAATVAIVCARHDVCWLESDSEHDVIRLLLTVGAPTRRESDMERLIDAVGEIGQLDDVRVGVARGRAFVCDVGHKERRTYNVMGPVVNLAARLAGSAAKGTIVLTAEVAALVDGSFDVVPAPSLTLKGIGQPVDVAELQGRRAVPVSPPLRGRLRGRHDELRQFDELIDGLDGTHGAAIELVAEAGSGKSLLVREIVTNAAVSVFWAAGRRDRVTTPYAAISPLLRSALDVPADFGPDRAGAVVLDRVSVSAPHLVPLAPLIATAAHARVPASRAAEAIAPQFRGVRTREVVTELLAAMRPEPTVFVGEDVHWFDVGSRLIMEGLAAAAQPWLVVATRRPTGEPLEGFEVMPLGPLDDRAIREAVFDAIGDAPMSRRQLTEITAASSGNPLFARELALAATRAEPGTLPDRVDGIIASRMDDLDLESRSMLRDLSAAGMNVDADFVDLLLDEHGLGMEALSLLGDFLTQTDSGVEFRHDLYRRAAYEGLAVKRRRDLHGRLVTVLAGRPDAGDRSPAIADHAHHARDSEATWRWARSAAAVALELGAAHEAAIHLKRALAAAGSLDVGSTEEARVAESLGDALELAGQPVDAHAAYRRARQALSGDPIEQARLCRKHARVDERAGRYRASLGWSTRGLKLLDGDGHDDIAAELRLVAGVIRFFQGRFDEAIELADAAAHAAERTGATAVLAQAYLQLEMTYSELGRKVERARHGARALELLETLDDRLGLANLHLNLGVSQYNEARWPEAIGHYERSAHYYRLVGDTIGAEAARNNQAEILTDQGRLDEAAVILEEVERALRAAQYELGIAITISGRARVALRRGELDLAGSLLDEAGARFVGLDARHMVIDTDVRRVEHLVWAERADEAERLAEQVERDLEDAGPVAVLPATLSRLRGWCALLLGDSATARGRFRRGLELAEAEAFDYEVALALDALCVSGGKVLGGPPRQRPGDLLDDLGIVRVPRPPWFQRHEGARL